MTRPALELPASPAQLTVLHIEDFTIAETDLPAAADALRALPARDTFAMSGEPEHAAPGSRVDVARLLRAYGFASQPDRGGVEIVGLWGDWLTVDDLQAVAALAPWLPTYFTVVLAAYRSDQPAYALTVTGQQLTVNTDVHTSYTR